MSNGNKKVFVKEVITKEVKPIKEELEEKAKEEKIEEVKLEEETTETKKLFKINKPKKGEKIVQINIGNDPYGNPSWKFVPESQAKDFK